MYEKMLEGIFQSTDWPPDETILQLFRQKPNETVPLLLRAIEESDKVDGATAIDILGMIGHPENKAAIPTMVGFLGADINDPRYLSTCDALFQMEPDVTVLHIIRALLDKGAPYHIVRSVNETSWAEDVAGICWTISARTDLVDQAYALRCCPAVNALLLQADPAWATDFCLSALLSVIERAGETVDYVIPSLIELIKRDPENKIGKRARQLLTTFKPETLGDYTLLLNWDKSEKTNT